MKPVVIARVIRFICGSLLSAILYAGGSATILLVESVLPGHTAFAQEGGAQPQRKTRRTPALREKIYKRLSDAQAQMEKNNFPSAMAILNEVKADTTINSYERAMAWNFTAYAYSMQEKYKDAIGAYKQVLAQPELPEALELGAVYAIAQLYLATEQYQLAIDNLKKWMTLTAPSPSAYTLLGQAYYQMDDFKASVAAVEKGLAIVQQQGGQPQETALQILRAGYMELGNNNKLLEVVELLVRLYPKGHYFTHLSQIYGDRNDEQRQLLTLEAAYDGGYLTTQNQYLSVASLLLQSEVPYKAAKVMTEGIKKNIIEENVNNLKFLAQAWLLAQEPDNAIEALQKAAKKSDDGELYVRLGRSYADLDQWSNCIDSVRSGLKKGKVERIDSAYFTLGICLFNADNLDGAIEAFELARKDERSRQSADQWSAFLRSEKDRRQRLENSLL
jgi:tetratricopeptide (TPR) repeat protein